MCEISNLKLVLNTIKCLKKNDIVEEVRKQRNFPLAEEMFLKSREATVLNQFSEAFLFL